MYPCIYKPLLTSIAKGKECATISRHKWQHKQQHKQPHILQNLLFSDFFHRCKFSQTQSKILQLFPDL